MQQIPGGVRRVSAPLLLMEWEVMTERPEAFKRPLLPHESVPFSKTSEVFGDFGSLLRFSNRL